MASARFDKSYTLQNRARTFKVIVIGEQSTGKTCLVFRFCEGIYVESPMATIGVDFFRKKVTVDGENIQLQIWDTAGQELFRHSIIPRFYKGLHGVVLVYDMTKFKTFQELPYWINELHNHLENYADIPLILVGNKCDCEDKLAVSTNMAQKFADNHNMPLFETSAKDDNEAEHVNAIFMTLAHKIKICNPMMQSSQSDSSDNTTIKLNSSSKNAISNDSGCCGC